MDQVQIPLGKPVATNVKDTTLLYNEFIVYDVAQVTLKIQFFYNWDSLLMLYKPFYLGQHQVPPQNQVPLQVEWINDIPTFHLLDAFTLDCIVILRKK